MITEEQKSILNIHDLVCGEATGVVDIIAFIEKEPAWVAFLGNNVLLDGGATHLNPHVGHDDSLTIISSRSDEFIDHRCSLLKSESVSLIN